MEEALPSVRCGQHENAAIRLAHRQERRDCRIVEPGRLVEHGHELILIVTHWIGAQHFLLSLVRLPYRLLEAGDGIEADDETDEEGAQVLIHTRVRSMSTDSLGMSL